MLDEPIVIRYAHSRSGRVARSKRSRTAAHSGKSGGMTTTIASNPSMSYRCNVS